jgi:hypothetical protein
MEIDSAGGLDSSDLPLPSSGSGSGSGSGSKTPRNSYKPLKKASSSSMAKPVAFTAAAAVLLSVLFAF